MRLKRNEGGIDRKVICGLTTASIIIANAKVGFEWNKLLIDNESTGNSVVSEHANTRYTAELKYQAFIIPIKSGYSNLLLSNRRAAKAAYTYLNLFQQAF
ncbi:hypothetical protein [Roseivirga sp.]|uniref:hypothetical protein n=1 Tax=Roseivirga sp. TaxID=1964215 RepID=UPI003B51904F